MMFEKLLTGSDDFREFIEGQYFFVDKSLFIKEFLNKGKVTLITRPRRWGKTLNMSMLQHFLAPIVGGRINKGFVQRFINIQRG